MSLLINMVLLSVYFVLQETSTQADVEAQVSLPSTPRLIMLGKIPVPDKTQHRLTLSVVETYCGISNGNR